MLYAHSVDGRPESEWEPLERHLTEVAQLAARFAEAFQAADWGQVVGLWHDAGKALPAFQARLLGAAVRVEHAGAGAVLADSKSGALRTALAFAIAGHHAGLCNEEAEAPTGETPLRERLRRNRVLLDELSGLAPVILNAEVPRPPAWLDAAARAPGPQEERIRPVRLSAEMFTRFLFSALVDADRLATETFLDPHPLRDQPWPALDVINARLDQYLATLQATADPALAVNTHRSEVLHLCRLRALDEPGVFTLTVPTGGGKTFAAMSFALRHALANALRRVIVAIPFTSIIEQNADAYRKALGADAVVEHHTGFDEESAREQCDEREARRRWATENWDPPSSSRRAFSSSRRSSRIDLRRRANWT